MSKPHMEIKDRYIDISIDLPSDLQRARQMTDRQADRQTVAIFNNKTLKACPRRSGTREGRLLSPTLNRVLEIQDRAIIQETKIKGNKEFKKKQNYLCSQMA